MIRLLIAVLMLAGSVTLLARTQAQAQSPNPVLLAPPAARVGMAPPAPHIPRTGSSQGPMYVHVPGSARDVIIPSGTRFKTFHDRVAACTHYGAASGLRSGKLNAFVGSCAN
jgi:hypothetical protein